MQILLESPWDILKLSFHSSAIYMGGQACFRASESPLWRVFPEVWPYGWKNQRTCSENNYMWQSVTLTPYFRITAQRFVAICFCVWLLMLKSASQVCLEAKRPYFHTVSHTHTHKVTIQILGLVGLSPKSSIPRITKPISLPSPPHCSNLQLHSTCNINNLIYFLPLFHSRYHWHTHAYKHKNTEGSARSHSLICVCRKYEPRSIQ